MRLISVGPVGAERPAVLRDEETYVDLIPLLTRHGITGDMNTVLGLLPYWRDDVLPSYVASAPGQGLAGTRLGAPVPRPRNVIAVGANTHSHVKEAALFTDGYTSQTPMMIIKSTTSVCGPYDDIKRPAETQKLDYETELAVVIGRFTQNVDPAHANDHIAGYMACNDVTARDVQMGEGEDSNFYWQHARGKSYETFLPTGPWLSTPDEIEDVKDLTLQSFVNEDSRQDSTVRDLVADVPTIISSISSCVPLFPGDILVTGSPAGVGAFMTPPGWLVPGDVLRTVVAPIGELSNRVVDA